ncbi:MAG: hypothetical protein GEV08_24275 [Acidimicrobiia bacterium]|nr:hypothetical protein [Acidimicrobiia bacterium]
MTVPTGPGDLAAVVDRLAIDDVLSSYAAGLDAQDWRLWRSIFVPEVVFDMQSVHGRPPVLEEIDKTVSVIRVQFAGFRATQHVIVNRRHTIEGDRAQVLATMQAWHWFDERCYTMFGYYDDKLVRTAEGWRLAEVQLNLTRTDGDPAVMKDAWRRGKELIANV